MNIDANDAIAIKRVLGILGLYREPKWGFSPWPDEPMFQGIQRFQIDNGLDPDGVIRPNGPTERTLDDRFRAHYEKLAARSRRAPRRRPRTTEPGRSRSLFAHVEPFGAGLALEGSSDRSAASEPQLGARADEAPRASEQTTNQSVLQPSRSRDDLLNQALDKIEKHYRRLVEEGRLRGYNTAADNLEWYLDGRGGVKRLRRNEAIEFEWVHDAEKINNERFVEGTFTGNTNSKSAKRLLTLMPGDPPIQINDKWDVDLDEFGFLRKLFSDTNFALSFGRNKLQSTGNFRARFQGDLIVVEGTITHVWDDDFDFHCWQPFAEGALTLEQYRGARPFKTRAEWEQPVRAHLKRENGKLVLAREPIWGKVKEIY